MTERKMNRSILITFFYLIVVAYAAVQEKDLKTICARKIVSIANIADDEGVPEEINNDQPIEVCQHKNANCFALWREDSNGTVTIMGQGCWESSGKPHDCERKECISDRAPAKALNNTIFCCCSGNLCNLNFTNSYEPTTPSSVPETAPKPTLNPLMWLILGIGIFFIFIMLLCGLMAYLWFYLKPKKADIEMGQHNVPPPPDYSLDKLKLLSLIGQGRYGSVWKGVVDDQEVAVKVFPAHHRNYFINEYDIYKVAGDNSCLLKCFGGGERPLTTGGPVDYLLILSLEQECLQEYLKNNTLDLATLSKMALGIARGLAHLHSDLGKLCVAHRDINTRNILVRTDLTCVICDLGLAVIPKRTENKALSEAGTLRYMAPEVLEGAVNLRDCESALKQIDVYALGLVLWEMGTRCIDMQSIEPAPYAPPFHKEAGDNPSLEQMQTLVSRRKARPLWPSSWKDTAAARLLCETAEDCWDQDAEARLTSLCVEERLLELPTLKGRVLHPMHPPISPTPLINNNHLHDHNIDASVGTIETLLSPTEENCKNSNQLAVCIPPLQPFQGRNPCLERNLLSGSSDSLLIDKSSKHCASSESQNLITNDFLNYHMNHRATPIPYVQNAVQWATPKQNNVAVTPSKAKFRWSGLKRLFHHKKNSNSGRERKDTQVRIVPGKLVNSFGQNEVTTSLLSESEVKRPSTLPLTVVKASDVNESPGPKANISGVSQIIKRDNSLLRQRSLEQFNEVFSSTSDLSRLKDPSQRVKTPGDVPPSVRRTRGKAAKESARFSLYDDRMMCHGQWGSAPELDPKMQPLKPPPLNDGQDRDSVSSF